ncbi:MAG: Polyhydroxyalkanoic acid synthase [Actinomycetia bacterium]|nr:Polyhydroxyalkanoic acid synthase [Actinomycetes bacterium]
MPIIPKALFSLASRLGATAQNALEVARFGGLDTDEATSPYEVVAEQRVYRLRHYFPSPPDGQDLPDDGVKRPIILLVPPLMITAEVYDISPMVSAIGVLHRRGVDAWVVDFGAPEREPGGLERTLTDHVLAVSDAIDRVREITGRDVHLAGYSQGGMFCYQAAAYRRGEGIESVVTFGSPADTHAGLPFGLPGWIASETTKLVPDWALGDWAVPGWVTRTGFQLLSPVKSVRNRVDFIRQLHDREVLAPRERQRRFMQSEGWVAWPGPALAEFVRQFVGHNRMLTGGFVIGDRLVTLADIACPVLAFVGEVDEIALPAAVRGIRRAAPRAEMYEAVLPTGHFGMVAGSLAAGRTWPAVAAWLHWRAGDSELPELISRIRDEDEEPLQSHGLTGYGLQLAAGAGVDAVRSVAVAASRAVRGARHLTGAASAQLPRLARLERIQPDTPMSLGLLLDEQARRAPDAVFFLFDGRAHTQAAVKHRIDSVVRGLIEIGVRQGDQVGVLMGTRPSALAALAALNRLGAVAVLLRPDGDLAREVHLGQVERIIADPEHAARAVELDRAEVCLLGGGAAERDLGLPLIDMERIDPDEVELPGWYRPNPGRASDLAFILFTGEGEQTRAGRITNRRWALSAFGTASSAALSPADTVYSFTPLNHPSALLMTIGGAVAGGARVALATAYDPATFWDEVRRYGATVVSYTWTMTAALVNAPPDPGERHHSVRLFIGSGMPRGLWRRVEQRFAPARVLEFYASTQGEAILVNLSGKKPGSLGRPLPGSAEVRLAVYDLEHGRLAEGENGFAIECGPDEVGMLLAKVRTPVTGPARPLRGVFAPADAWVVTGDLFRRDAEGDFWLLGQAAELIRTAEGIVPPGPIRTALGDLTAVDLAVAYGVPVNGVELAAAAVTLRPGSRLRAVDLTEAFLAVPPPMRPALIRIVDEIPVTDCHRPRTAPLREEGIPAGAAFYREATGGYRPLTATDRGRLKRRAR